VLAFWTEWTNIAWTIVHQAVTNHFVLALEPFPALRAGAACDRTVVWTTLAVDVLMRAADHMLAGNTRNCKQFDEHT
jgi:hypothetical protein